MPAASVRRTPGLRRRRPTSRWPSNRNSARGRSGASRRSPRPNGVTAAEASMGAERPPSTRSNGAAARRRCNARRPAHCAPASSNSSSLLRACTPSAPGHDRHAPPTRRRGEPSSGADRSMVPGKRKDEDHDGSQASRAPRRSGPPWRSRELLVAPGGGHLSRRRGPARVRDDRPRRQQRHLRRAAERPEPAAADHGSRASMPAPRTRPTASTSRSAAIGRARSRSGRWTRTAAASTR